MGVRIADSAKGKSVGIEGVEIEITMLPVMPATYITEDSAVDICQLSKHSANISLRAAFSLDSNLFPAHTSELIRSKQFLGTCVAESTDGTAMCPVWDSTNVRSFKRTAKTAIIGGLLNLVLLPLSPLNALYAGCLSSSKRKRKCFVPMTARPVRHRVVFAMTMQGEEGEAMLEALLASVHNSA